MLYSAFILGLFSSLHCIGMCGPIALMLPLDHKNITKKSFQILTYNLGRISAYASIGFVFGLLGRGFFMAGFQQKLSVVVGILIIITAIVPSKIFSKYNFSKPIFIIISKIKVALGAQFRKKNNQSLFTIGILNGFLPCGMVYVAVFGALAMQSPVYSSVFMILFGLGTIPTMSFVTVFSSFFSNSVRNKVQKIIPIITIVLGVLFILRGLGLGIAYVSPSNMSLFVLKNADCH